MDRVYNNKINGNKSLKNDTFKSFLELISPFRACWLKF